MGQGLIGGYSFEDFKDYIDKETVVRTVPLRIESRGLELPGNVTRPDIIKTNEYPTAKTRWGLSLQSLRLDKEIGGLFQKTYKIYFLAWVWDLSGTIKIYPGIIEGSPTKIVYPISCGETHEFVGSGLGLWELKEVIGGLNIRLMLWNNKQDERDLGEALTNVNKAIDDSGLLDKLSLLNTAAGPTGPILDGIEAVVNKLVGIVGTILAAGKDQNVDTYEGRYLVSDPWIKGNDSYSGHSTFIVLRKSTDS